MAYPTLTDGRQFVRELALHASSLDYSDTMVDLAIKGAAFAYFEKMGNTYGSGTVAITAGAQALDFSAITGFTPMRVKTLYIGNYPVVVRQEPWLREKILNQPQTARPTHIAFTSETAALCWQTPDAAYTLNVSFEPALVEWTSGMATPNTVTLNIPVDHLMNVCTLGATVILLKGDPRAAYGTREWMQYLDWIDNRMVRRDTEKITLRDQATRWRR